MKKYVAYYRISKDYSEKEKERKGIKSSNLGMDAQKEIVQHFYPELTAEFVETKSAATITERPVLQEAVEYCLKNDCVLVVAKLDRLSRNVDDCRAIVNKLDRKVIFCDIPTSGDTTDMLIITILAAVAERERELISIRTKQALAVKLERDGAWQTGNKLFGTKENLDASKKALREKRAKNENLIRASAMIKQLHEQSKKPAEIAEYLNKNSYRTSQGKMFRPTQVTRILAQA